MYAEKEPNENLKHVSDFALARFSFVRRFLQETKHCFQHAYSWATTMGNETKRTSAKHVHECAVSQLWFWLYRLVVIGTRKVWEKHKMPQIGPMRFPGLQRETK